MEKQREIGFGEAMSLLEKLLVGIASLTLLMLTLLTTADALGRYLLNSPIPGTGEIIEDYFMIALIFLPLSYSFAVRRLIFSSNGSTSSSAASAPT